MAAKKLGPEKTVSERAQHCLKVLVERYIRDGQPVGSRTLARDAALDLSPATIRNVMADLEDMGLITAPHTSAGRVPTVHGYRFFVDSLLTVSALDEVELEQLKHRLATAENPEDLMKTATQLLSGMTHMAGLVRLPRRERIAFRHVEFLSLSHRRVLIILVTNEDEVHNRIITTKRQYTAAELEQAASYLNQTFAGKEIRDVRQDLLRDMNATRLRMDRIMRAAVEMGDRVLETGSSKNDYLIAGQVNLMDFDELATMDRLRELFNAFTQKNEIVHLLDECMQAEGIQIFIGEESGYKPFGECSLVAAPYQVEGEVLGVLGVIGPTRMAYDRVIPIVDITAKLLSAALKHR